MTKELKLVTEKEWDEHKMLLGISKIQSYELDIAMQNLHSTSLVGPTINKLLLLKVANIYQDSELKPPLVKSKTSTNHKVGNINIAKFYI